MRTIAALLAAFPLLAAAQTDEPVPPPAQAAPAYAPPPTYAPPPQGAAPAAPQYYARPSRSRDSWYIGFGLGGGGGSVERGGSRLSFSEYGQMVVGLSSDPLTLSMSFKVGATLSPQLLLGLDVTAIRSQWSESGLDFGTQITNYDAVATFFPMREGLFLRGGVGISRFTWNASGGGASADDSAVGFNVLLGAGYAFWLGQHFNLTVNLDFSAQNYGTQNDVYAMLPESSRAWSLGAGCDWY